MSVSGAHLIANVRTPRPVTIPQQENQERVKKEEERKHEEGELLEEYNRARMCPSSSNPNASTSGSPDNSNNNNNNDEDTMIAMSGNNYITARGLMTQQEEVSDEEKEAEDQLKEWPTEEDGEDLAELIAYCPPSVGEGIAGSFSPIDDPIGNTNWGAFGGLGAGGEALGDVHFSSHFPKGKQLE